MSNVLIGIIGVILFIGLALAGALILGDDFKTASASSRAATVQTQLQQVSSAVSMYRLKTGNSDTKCLPLDFLMPRFLKSVPISPMAAYSANTSSNKYKPQLNNDLLSEPSAADAQTLKANLVTTDLGSDADAKNTCQAIADMGNGTITNEVVNTVPAASSGCSMAGGEYIAFTQI